MVDAYANSFPRHKAQSDVKPDKLRVCPEEPACQTSISSTVKAIEIERVIFALSAPARIPDGCRTWRGLFKPEIALLSSDAAGITVSHTAHALAGSPTNICDPIDPISMRLVELKLDGAHFPFCVKAHDHRDIPFFPFPSSEGTVAIRGFLSLSSSFPLLLFKQTGRQVFTTCRPVMQIG